MTTFQPSNMETQPHHKVSYAERAGGGIVITFNDGKCALFPADLLYSTLPHAQEIQELEEKEE
jgi:hypothetical protein